MKTFIICDMRTIIYKSIFCFIFLLTFTALLWKLWL